MEIDADHVETKRLTESHFLVQDFMIECILLPHLELVDGISRNITASYRPLGLSPPCASLLRGPLSADRFPGRKGKAKKHSHKK
jgi:hypothetical protein